MAAVAGEALPGLRARGPLWLIVVGFSAGVALLVLLQQAEGDAASADGALTVGFLAVAAVAWAWRWRWVPQWGLCWVHLRLAAQEIPSSPSCLLLRWHPALARGRGTPCRGARDAGAAMDGGDVLRRISAPVLPGSARMTSPPDVSLLKHPRRCSSMAEHQLPKLNTRVRFPSSAPPKSQVRSISPVQNLHVDLRLVAILSLMRRI